MHLYIFLQILTHWDQSFTRTILVKVESLYIVLYWFDMILGGYENRFPNENIIILYSMYICPRQIMIFLRFIEMMCFMFILYGLMKLLSISCSPKNIFILLFNLKLLYKEKKLPQKNVKRHTATLKKYCKK